MLYLHRMNTACKVLNVECPLVAIDQSGGPEIFRRLVYAEYAIAEWPTTQIAGGRP